MSSQEQNSSQEAGLGRNETRRSERPDLELARFEELFQQLQDSVSRLESGELTLEQAFQEWESGCESYVACRRLLEGVRARVETLVTKFADDEPMWEPFRVEGREAAGTAASGAHEPGGEEAGAAR